MSKLICGECNKTFDGDAVYDPIDECWVCPHCDTLLQEPEL